MWLRERSLNPKFVQKETGQPFVDVHDVSSTHDPAARQRVQSAVVNENRTAFVVTFGDAHVMELNIEHLKKELADFESTGVQTGDVPPVPRRFWNAATIGGAPSFHEHDELVVGPAMYRARANFLEALLRDGVAVVRSVPCEDEEAFRFCINLVGQVRHTHWGHLFKVIAKPAKPEEAHDLAYSASAIRFSYIRQSVQILILLCKIRFLLFVLQLSR